MKNKKDILIVDFDHTISNSRRVNKELVEIFGSDFDTVAKDLGVYTKDPRLDSMRAKLPEYRFPDANLLLENMKKHYKKVILLTRSIYDLTWQTTQIKHADISKYFDQVIITEKPKVEELADVISNQSAEITFVNDIYASTPENELMREAYPHLEVIDIDNYTDEGYSIGDFYRSLS